MLPKISFFSIENFGVGRNIINVTSDTKNVTSDTKITGTCDKFFF